MTEQEYNKAKQGLVMARINALNEIEAMLSFNLSAEDMQTEIKRILADVKAVQQTLIDTQPVAGPTPTEKAVQRLTKAGYVAVAMPDGAIMVQDPYFGYNAGVYGLDGYTEVTLKLENVSKFIDARK